MNKLVSIVPILALALLVAGCAPEPLKQAGLQGESTLTLVRDLTSAYERRDLEAFLEKVAPSYPDRDAFRQSLENVFATYQTIRLKVQFSRMQVLVKEKGNIQAVFTWEGEWQTRSGKTVRDGARSTLVIDKGVFKLLAVEGKNLYLPVETQAPIRP